MKKISSLYNEMVESRWRVKICMIYINEATLEQDRISALTNNQGRLSNGWMN